MKQFSVRATLVLASLLGFVTLLLLLLQRRRWHTEGFQTSADAAATAALAAFFQPPPSVPAVCPAGTTLSSVASAGIAGWCGVGGAATTQAHCPVPGYINNMDGTCIGPCPAGLTLRTAGASSCVPGTAAPESSPGKCTVGAASNTPGYGSYQGSCFGPCPASTTLVANWCIPTAVATPSAPAASPAPEQKVWCQCDKVSCGPLHAQ